MIYLARNGKRFGPFSADELTPKILSEYSWILDARNPASGWQPVDPRPAEIAPPASRSATEALAISRQGGRAVSGALEVIRLRSGTLVTDESSIRLEPGTTIEVLIGGQKPFPALVEKVDYEQRKARYQLSWSASNAPG